MRTLYVGNIPWSTDAAELSAAFAAHGAIHGSRIIVDKESGRSKGFGFVEVDDSDADRMIEALNGADFNGRPLTVNQARRRENPEYSY